jgi:hypothetical protein
VFLQDRRDDFHSAALARAERHSASLDDDAEILK